MRILLVHPGAEFSIWDVAQGLRRALVEQGHEIADYYITRRMTYHAAAMELGGADVSQEHFPAIAKQACENVIVEALYHRADLVLLVSGLNFHPIGIKLLDLMREPRIPVAIVLTESPYEDPQQAEFCGAHPDAVIFTNERSTARMFGWHYLPHAFDPQVHQPGWADPAEACDVLMLATGWPERQELLEQVNWTGIKLRLIGPWPYLPADHALRAYLDDHCVDNPETPRLYASAKICLNFFRRHPGAESLGPRTYELAACGAFQLSDPRPELSEKFSGSIPVFHSASELEGLIRYYLGRDRERVQLAAEARNLVRGETFASRAEMIMRAVRGATPALDRTAALSTT